MVHQHHGMIDKELVAAVRSNYVQGAAVTVASVTMRFALDSADHPRATISHGQSVILPEVQETR